MTENKVPQQNGDQLQLGTADNAVFLLDLFKQDKEKKDLAELLDNIKSVPLGMSEFQIEHFVLNKIEYPTDWAKFQQVKIQLYLGIQSLADLFFQIQEAQICIELAEAENESLNKEPASKIINAKIRLKEINVEKNKFKIAVTQHTAIEKLKEILKFYGIYKSLKKLDNITNEESKRLEEETWKLRSMYNPEFKNRYALTPDGFQPLPHEINHSKMLSQKK